MTRNGKIARLPKAIRDELNQRLDDGQMGVWLVEWLNSLPEVQTMLAEQFDGRAINEVNLTEWKGGGFQDWQARRDMRVHAQELAEESSDLKTALPGPLAEHLNMVVAGRYAELLNKWNGEVNETFVKRVKGLRLLSENITGLRREDVRVERLALEQDKRSEDKKKTQAKALDLCLDASKKFPKVADSFKKAFDLLDEAEGISIRPPGEAAETGGD